jgi:predicted DCC family thiol-disulfide oxidoreductase YuxK
MSKYVIAYDADCGPCTRFKNAVDILDRYNRLDFLSLSKADELGLLDKIPQSLKYASFHLISPSGDVISGADALPHLIGLFPLGRPISKGITLLPGAKRMTRFVYSAFSRLRESGSCKFHYE